MSITLPPVIADYIRASNDQDTEAVIACFADDAVVRDERREMRGHAAIRDWRQWVTETYHPTMEVVSAEATSDGARIVATVRGTFPGSPVEIHSRFQLAGGKIALLDIG